MTQRNSTMLVLYSKAKKLWSSASIKVKQIEHINWKNRKAAPNCAYIPTAAEHCANILTHGVCVLPSVLGFLALLERSHKFAQFWAALVYGSSLILIFTVSTFFHCVFFCFKNSLVVIRLVVIVNYMLLSSTGLLQLRFFLHRCDRAVIYIFIAASYYPWVTLRASPEGTLASHLHWIIWVLAFCGISYQQIFHERYKKLETFFYVFMGVAPALTVLNTWTDLSGFKEIQLGGFIYGFGIIFFKLDGTIPCAHAIWHLFVAVAAGVHYKAILFYLYPTSPQSSLSET